MMIGDYQQQKGPVDGTRDGVVKGFHHPQPLVNGDVSEDLLAAHITRDKKTLFWVPVGVQDGTAWAMIDTDACRNLISKRDYEAVPHPTELRPPGSMMIVAANNQEIPLLGWITLRFTINTRTAYHDFGVAKN